MDEDTLIVLTEEHLKKALSVKGTLNKRQFQSLGYDGCFRGWRRGLTGRLHRASEIEEFLSLRNAHIKKKPKAKRVREPHLKKIILEDVEPRGYPDSVYNTKEWRDKRTIIYRRDSYRCVKCSRRGQKGVRLNVHHLLYIKGAEVWEVPDFYLVTLCEKCHTEEHSLDLSPPKNLS